MIWTSPFNFHPKAEKCLYSYIMEALHKYAVETPEKKVLISAEDPSHFLTYQQLVDQIRAVEAYLHKIGFGKGQVATVVMPSYIEVIPFYLAVLGRGGIYSGMSPMLTEFEVNRQLTDGGTTVVLTCTGQLEKVKEATKTMVSQVTIICIDNTGASVTSWTDVLKTEGEAPKHSNNIHDVAVLPYSSGTTGMPKGVMLTHFNIASAMLTHVRHTDELVPRPFSSTGGTEPVWNRPQLLGMPSYHLSGKFFVLCHLFAGATVVILSKFDLRVYLQSIEKYKVWNLNLSPPALLQMIKDPMVEEFDVSSLGYVNSTAAPLAPSLANDFMTKFPNVMLNQLYAMSECLHPFIALCDRKDNFVSAGCVSPGFQAKIVHLESGKLLGEKEKGEVMVKGPCVMKGYLNKVEATKETVDEDGWLHTGDIGYFTEEGELFVVDRKKEMIKVNGLQVAPAEIESVLASDSRIADVGVVALPHPKHGEVPGAFIVKSSPNLSERDVQKLIKERVADFKWPDGVIVFVEKIPKLPSGKILRRQLRESVIGIN